MPNYRSDIVGGGPRGYMEIAYSVLSVCLNGAIKTHIMFRCNLNSKQLNFYVTSLLEKGMLEKIRDPPSAKMEYRTTQRGRKYMETYSALFQMLSERKGIESQTYI
jgi:predicted transcriptional regulator